MSDTPEDMPPYFDAPGFSDSYWFELLFDKPPVLDPGALLGLASSRMPVEIMASAIGANDGTVSFAYPDRLLSVGDMRLPVMTNVAWSNAKVNLSEYKSALAQTWEWDGARKALGRCWYKMIVGDITGSRLPYAERFSRLTALTAACLELTGPQACFWKEAGCLVEPARFEERVSRICNVRRFDIGVGFNRHMDTLGLAAIGLPDVEITFARIEPEAVAAFLYETAGYLFKEGDIINDGDTVPGPEDARWKTAHDTATQGPPRTVVRVTVTGTYAPSIPRG